MSGRPGWRRLADSGWSSRDGRWMASVGDFVHRLDDPGKAVGQGGEIGAVNDFGRNDPVAAVGQVAGGAR